MKGKNKVEVNPKLGEGMEMKKDNEGSFDAMKDLLKRKEGEIQDQYLLWLT